MQVYFFSVVVIIFSGVLLSNASFGKRFKYDVVFNTDFLEHKTVGVVFGILAALAGVIFILSPTVGDIPVVGDIIPALLGIVGGVSLVLKSLGKDSYAGENKFVAWLYDFLGTNLSILGLLMIIMGVIHILFPQTVLL